MRVSAIIPSLFEVDGDYLKLCIESLRATTEFDIIVVTNGSISKPDLSHIKGITRHIHTRDQGQCVATNIGADLANGEYYFVSNSDMYYAPGWNKKLRFEYPIFSPNLVEPTDNAGSAEPFLKFNGGLDIANFRKDMVDGFVKRQLDSIEDDEPGFNLPFFIHHKFWTFLRGYDTFYDPWGSNSDTDLQTRINLAGITPMRLPNVLVYHFSNKSGTFDGTHQDFYAHNIEYFKNKFGFDRDELGSDVWYNKDMIPEDKGRIKYEQKPYIY